LHYLNAIPGIVYLDAACRAPFDPMVDHKKSKPPEVPSFWSDGGPITDIEAQKALGEQIKKVLAKRNKG